MGEEKEIQRIIKSSLLPKNKRNREESIKLEKIMALYSISKGYFVDLVKLGREDLVEKYLKQKMTAIFGNDLSSSEARETERKVREKIRVFTE